MLIWSNGRFASKWSERDECGEWVSLHSLPKSLDNTFKRAGQYEAKPSTEKGGTLVVFSIVPSGGHSKYPAKYAVDHALAYVCKSFLKVLTGKTKITEELRVSVRIKYLGPKQ